MKEQTIFSVKDLSKRWDIDDTSVRKMVADGRLTPLEEFKTLKFSIKEVQRIEFNRLCMYLNCGMEDILEFVPEVKETDKAEE